jgi:poly(A) polymerase
VARKLREAGHRSLFAGGCVRDSILGLEAADFDVATSAIPAEIRQIFPRAMGVGESFGVMLVRHGGRSIEVATFRADGVYVDGRRPDAVRFSDDREDAARRDFTINGLFEDPETGEIIDHVGGRADLAAGILRAIGSADDRLHEDRLRALRAARFAARFALTIDPGTEAAVRRIAHDLTGVSRERIGNEVRRMLLHSSRARAVDLIESLGLAPSVLGESAPTGDHALLRALPVTAGFAESLAAWMLGRLASDTSPARQRRWREALILSNEESDLLAAILSLRPRIAGTWVGGDRAVRKRLAAAPGFAGAMAILRAEHHPVVAAVDADLPALHAEGIQPAPLVTGDDLVAMGMCPGPAFRPMLDRAYDVQLNGGFSDRDAALATVRKWRDGYTFKHP